MNNEETFSFYVGLIIGIAVGLVVGIAASFLFNQLQIAIILSGTLIGFIFFTTIFVLYLRKNNRDKRIQEEKRNLEEKLKNLFTTKGIMAMSGDWIMIEKWSKPLNSLYKTKKNAFILYIGDGVDPETKKERSWFIDKNHAGAFYVEDFEKIKKA